MNIGLITEYYPPFTPGGAEWSTQALARALVDAGHSATVVTPSYGRRVAGVVSESGVRLVRFPFPIKLTPGQKSVRLHTHANPAFYLYSAVRIAQMVRAYHIDILHAQGTYSLPGTLWAARLTGTRAFFTLRDTTSICPISVCLLRYDFVPDDCRLVRYRRECLPEFQMRYLCPAAGPGAARRWISFGAQWWDARLRRACLARVDGIVAVSQGILDVYVHSGLVRSEHARVIYNIPPTERPAPGRVTAWRDRLSNDGALISNGKEASQVVLYVGKFSPGKGTPDLVEASHIVVEQVPQSVFIFAGKGELGASAPHIANLGTLSHADVLALYRLADVVVVPSVGPESLSRVILEAMAAGRPVVATRRGGSPEAVAEGVTGLLVPRSNPEALADAIIALLADAPRRRRLGQAARQRLCDLFSPARSVERLIEFYQEKLG